MIADCLNIFELQYLQLRVSTPLGKSWKVLEFFFKIPRPGKSWKITLVLEKS